VKLRVMAPDSGDEEKALGFAEPRQFFRKPKDHLPTVGARIAAARQAAGLSQSDLAREVGVTRGAAGQWEAGTTQPSSANLGKIALATGFAYEWLATGRGRPRSNESSEELYTALAKSVADKLADAGGGLIVSGVVEGGSFRAVKEDTARQAKRVPIAPDVRFLKVPQFAWEVRDDAMALSRITEGMYVIGAPYGDFVREYGSIRDGSIVVVERLRFELTEREITLRCLTTKGDHRELVANPASSFENEMSGAFLAERSFNFRPASGFETFVMPNRDGAEAETSPGAVIRISAVALSAHSLLTP
jgi:transcriptional regulator with XRE-family HTH domain